MNYLPAKLLKLRKHYHYSQNYLAKILGVDTIEYMGFENGRTVPDYSQMKKLASFYHVNFADIFRNSEDVPLYDTEHANTDEINIEYFMKQNSWKEKARKYILRHRVPLSIIVALCVVILILFSMLGSGNGAPKYAAVEKDYNRLSVSETSVAYIDAIGAVKGSGDNTNSQLSNLPSSGAIKVAEGSSFTVVLKEDGTVESFGLIKKYADAVSKWNDIIDIAAGYEHIVSVDSKGKVYCTGSDDNGQCRITSASDVRHVYAFGNGSIAVRADGSVDVSGDFIGSSRVDKLDSILCIDGSSDNTAVVDANGNVTVFAKTKNFLSVNTWRNIVDVACGNVFVAGLTSDGRVLIDTENYLIEQEVKSWENIIAIAAGDEYLVAFDGEKIYGIGKDSYNQFTNGFSSKSKLPQVTNIRVSVYESFISVQFDGVTSAENYLVYLDAGIGQSQLVSDKRVVYFDTDSLEDGLSYLIEITARGNGDYEDSNPASIVFRYDAIKEEKEEKKEEEEIIEVVIPPQEDPSDNSTSTEEGSSEAGSADDVPAGENSDAD